MTGTLGILNVGAGDTKLSFDPSNPAECIRAARIVRDMLRRGYALLIVTGKDAEGRPIYARATDFDEATHEYIVADFDPTIAATVDAAATRKEPAHVEAQPQAASGLEAGPPLPATPKRRGRPPGKRIPAAGTTGVAVARTAGG